jgi:hypothetical protein
VLREAFPAATWSRCPCRALIWQNGSLHCITMQLPKDSSDDPQDHAARRADPGTQPRRRRGEPVGDRIARGGKCKAWREARALQELHNGPYFCQHESVERVRPGRNDPGPEHRAPVALAKQHGLVLVSSLFEKRATGLYHNTAVVFEADGNVAGKYRKMHIPDDPGFYEKFYFTPATWASNRSTPPSAASA